jgi:hypothetical protein
MRTGNRKRGQPVNMILVLFASALLAARQSVGLPRKSAPLQAKPAAGLSSKRERLLPGAVGSIHIPGGGPT